MTKLRLTFYEIEHEGDVAHALAQVQALGAREAICAAQDFDREECHIAATVDDPEAFLLRLRCSDACCWEAQTP